MTESLKLPEFYLRRSATLSRLRAERAECVSFVERTLDGVEQRSTPDHPADLSATETEGLTRQKARIAELDAQIRPLEEFEQLRGADQRGAEQYRPGNEFRSTGSAGSVDSRGFQRQERTPAGARTEIRSHEYRTRGEIVVDLIAQRTGSFDAAGAVIQVTERAKEAARERLMGAGIPFPGAPDEYLERIVNNVTGDAPGLMPKAIVGEVDNNIDASRPFVSSIGSKDLSAIPGKTFTRPIITGHTTSGKQTTEKTELASSKLVVGGVDFTKETHGGTVDVARQLIDWSSPGAWDALMQDLQDEYALDTEAAAAQAFAAAVTVTVPNATAETPAGWAVPLYAAAALAYAGSGRLPDTMWVSLDQWQRLGAAVDSAKLMSRRSDQAADGSPTDFAGQVLDLPRIVVPSFPAKTVIVGVKSKTEFYEQKIGFLSAIEPRLLGVEVAYGGYCAFGTLRTSAFAKLLIP